MEISIEKLTQLSKTSARAKVMIKQWFPDLLKDNDTIEEIPIELTQSHRRLGYSEVLAGMSLRNALRWNDTESESTRETTTQESIELEVGKWYTDGHGYLMIYTGDVFNCTGFFGDSWGHNWSFSHIDNSRLATEQEIGDALKWYCEVNGYTANNFTSLSSDCVYRNCVIGDWYYDYEEDTLYSSTEGNGGYVVYRNGNWAYRTHTSIEL